MNKLAKDINVLIEENNSIRKRIEELEKFSVGFNEASNMFGDGLKESDGLFVKKESEKESETFTREQLIDAYFKFNLEYYLQPEVFLKDEEMDYTSRDTAIKQIDLLLSKVEE